MYAGMALPPVWSCTVFWGEGSPCTAPSCARVISPVSLTNQVPDQDADTRNKAQVEQSQLLMKSSKICLG